MHVHRLQGVASWLESQGIWSGCSLRSPRKKCELDHSHSLRMHASGPYAGRYVSHIAELAPTGGVSWGTKTFDPDNWELPEGDVDRSVDEAYFISERSEVALSAAGSVLRGGTL